MEGRGDAPILPRKRGADFAELRQSGGIPEFSASHCSGRIFDDRFDPLNFAVLVVPQ